MALVLFDHEIPQEGLWVTRGYRYARWTDGSPHFWAGRTRGPGPAKARAACGSTYWKGAEMAVPLTLQQRWFLQFTSANFGGLTGGGRPWADGTDMASRAQPGAPNNVPWDSNCKVTTYVDGFAAMSAMRDALETVIAAATAAGAQVGLGGQVYIAGWRFNCLRDLSDTNVWANYPWNVVNPAASDQTAMGLVVRLLQAGVMVRIMVWLPTDIQEMGAPLKAHVNDHYLAARIVQYESNRIAPNLIPPLGVLALDARTAEKLSGSHHQKMMVIRSPATNIAFVGGVDLAYTRRSNLDPALPSPSGDWQSGQTIPNPAQWWPQEAGVNYTFQGQVPVMTDTQGPDLPPEVYGNSSALAVRQMWHDQHLKLEGPIVATIENQFRERWVDQGKLYALNLLGGSINLQSGQVIFSTDRAYDAQNQVVRPLPQPAAVPALAPPRMTQVQMWRTIPLRPSRNLPPFVRGEFTVMAGIANAVWQAQELIWMFDQYFWSLPLARLLNARLQARPELRLILILPPYADGSEGMAHLARKNALQALTNGVQDRVGVYNMWYQQPPGDAAASNRGIYVHAKSHTYDNSLLVCGSANLNRRSFLCDTELACAVLDPAVVTAHQQLLWAQLFPGAAWPNLNLSTAQNGALFFTRFQAAANAARNGGSFRLIRDPWNLSPVRLPNGVDRPVDQALPLTYDTLYEPSSVDLKVESELLGRAAGLDDVVTRLENTPGPLGDWPWRKP